MQEPVSNTWTGRIKEYIINIFDIRKDTLDKVSLQELMEENTIIQGSNMWILMMAILIASIGLNMNSTAVIIGAMLISPLMSGILTMGYSLATRDITMLRKSAARFGIQVIISLITSSLYFKVTPLTIATNEMIARTSPTLWDVLIALFGGIAGMIGNTRQKKSNVIPGVAIATALMPPLCTAGYGLATMQPSFFFGAFCLFAINTVFIMLSSALVTKLLKIPVHAVVDAKKQRRINRLITAITIITVIPSILISAITVYGSVMQRNVSDYLDEEFVFPDTQVFQSDVNYTQRVVSVSLVGTQISDDVIQRLEQEMGRYNLEGYSLHVTQNKTVSGENTDKVTIALQENTINQLQTQLIEQQEQLQAQQNTLTDLQSSISSRTDYHKLAKDILAVFPKVLNCGCGLMYNESGEYILLTATSNEPLTGDEEQTLKNWICLECDTENVILQLTEQGQEHDQ